MVRHVLVVIVSVLARALVTQGADDGARYLDNLLMEGSLGEAECDAALQAAADADRTSWVDSIPRLEGQWVSQGCEVRKGARYILRSVTFFGNLTFKFLTFHYSDASCTSPTYTIVAEGLLSLHGPSWTTSRASQSRVAVKRTSIAVHTETEEEELKKMIGKLCHGVVRRRWKRRREYNILLNVNHDVKNCSSVFLDDMKELALLKTQTRLVAGRRTRELLTGAEITENTQIGLMDSRPLFNPPLVHSDQRHVCSRCHTIGRGTEHSPPNLMALPRLPPYLAGEWVSERCEPLPLGVFLSRRLTFNPGDHSWALVASYHSDPACSIPSFIINAAGVFSKGGMENRSPIVDGAYNLDLTLLRAHVSVKDRALRTTLARSGCSLEPLSSGMIPGGGGCSPLGIHVPATTYSIVRLEVDLQGSPLLYIGRSSDPGKRATSYQPPLVQCSGLPQFAPLPLPLTMREMSSASKRSVTSHWGHVFLVFVLLLY